MTSTRRALRSGRTQGLIELRQAWTGTELIGSLFWPISTLGAIFFLRNRVYEESGLTLGALILPSVLGMFVAFGMLLVIQYLSADREDGTLLRAKATPNGIRGYFTGKLITTSGNIIAYLAVILVPGLLIVDGLDTHSLESWLTLVWVLALGLVATISVGAALGSLISSPRGAGYMALPVMALVSISGIFYPITALAGWVQQVAQVFPFYWLGLGMRSALLPDSAVIVEIGESWRHGETILVLGAWACLGLVVAPIVMSRMARKESGSSVEERRNNLLQRIG
jgi:ABC-2 type transport system permease protein